MRAFLSILSFFICVPLCAMNSNNDLSVQDLLDRGLEVQSKTAPIGWYGPEETLSVNLRDMKLTSLDGMQALLEQVGNEQDKLMLRLNNNNLKSLEGLPSDPRIYRLYLCCNNLVNFHGCPALPNLKILGVDGNELKSFDGLPQELPALFSISAHCCGLTSVRELSQYSALTHLFLKKNKLQSFADLPGNLELKGLYLDDNEFTSLAGMPTAFKNLRSLSLESNSLTSLHGMPDRMDQLEIFLASINELKSLDGMADAPNLKRLDVSYNELTNVDDVLKRLPKLQYFNYVNNDFSRLREWKYWLRYTLPSAVRSLVEQWNINFRYPGV